MARPKKETADDSADQPEVFGVYKKLHALKNRVHGVIRTGWNQQQGYRYLEEETLLDVVNPILDELGLIVLISCEEYSVTGRSIVSHEDKQQGLKPLPGNATALIKMRIVDIEDGSEIESTFPGYAEDMMGDKQLGKAITAGSKYAYWKTLGLAARNDSEHQRHSVESQQRRYDQRQQPKQQPPAQNRYEQKVQQSSQTEFDRMKQQTERLKQQQQGNGQQPPAQQQPPREQPVIGAGWSLLENVLKELESRDDVWTKDKLWEAAKTYTSALRVSSGNDPRSLDPENAEKVKQKLFAQTQFRDDAIQWMQDHFAENDDVYEDTDAAWDDYFMTCKEAGCELPAILSEERLNGIKAVIQGITQKRRKGESGEDTKQRRRGSMA